MRVRTYVKQEEILRSVGDVLVGEKEIRKDLRVLIFFLLVFCHFVHFCFSVVCFSGNLGKQVRV